ncbi:hypothetical protein HYQ45_008731 [Verticillium longisporum]|uniref:Uncharacterized protein n=1 Tax=Verticillium longisporum TaxID=100787 RepID=A0A8I2ZLK2_VERLO|nr:hypothetical protein HYQ45_008731 [Verticillium longisporum]
MTTSKADEHLMDSYMRTSDEDFKPQCNWPKGSLGGISMCIDALSRVPDQVWQARVPVDICVIRGEDTYITIRGSAWIGAPGGAHATSLEIITAIEWIRDQCTSCEGLDCYAGGAKAVGKNNKFIVKINGRNRKDGATGKIRSDIAQSTSKAKNSDETLSKRSSDEWDSCSWPRGPVKALVNNCVADQRRNPNRLYQTLDFIEICRVEGTEMDAEGRVETLQINGFVKEGADWAEASGTDILEALDWMRERCSTCRAARDDCYVGGFKAVGPKDDFIVQVVGGKKEDRLAARDAGEKSTSATKELARYIPDEELVNVGAKKAQADECTWPRGPMTSVLECMDQMKVDPEKVFKTTDWVRLCRIQGNQDRHMLSIYGYARDGHAEGEATADEVYQTLRWAKRYCTSCHEPHKNCYVGGWWLTGKKKNMVVQIMGSAPHKDARSLFLDAGEDANLQSLSPASPTIEAVPFNKTPTNDSAGKGQDDTPASLNKPIIYKYNDLTSNTTQYLFGPNREPLEATTNLTWSDVQQAASALTPTSRVAYDAQLLSADALNPSPECHANQVPTNGTYAQACLDFLWANRDNTWDMPQKTEVDICTVQVQTVRAGEDGKGEAWKDVFRMYATTCACRKGLKLQAGAAAAGLQRLMDTCSQCSDGGMCQVGATLQFEGNLELKLHVVSYSEKVEEPAAIAA